MKRLGLCLASLLVSAGVVSAQVEVRVTLDQGQFLPGESIRATVRVANHSGQTLHFGQEKWLTFAMEARDGFIVLKNGEAPIAHDFDLESARVATMHVDLAPYFTLSQVGHYTITATAIVDQWNLQATSAPQRFEVIHGTKLWEQEFGVPPASGASGGDPEVRKYALLQANYLKHMKLYVRVTDQEESRVYRVFSVGPMISFSRPQTEIDKLSNLHLLYQDGSRTFNYSVVNPDGGLVVRQTHRYTDSPPRLRMNDVGNVIVVGGMRQAADSDIPARGTASALTSELPPPTRPSTLPDDNHPPTP